MKGTMRRRAVRLTLLAVVVLGLRYAYQSGTLDSAWKEVKGAAMRQAIVQQEAARRASGSESWRDTGATLVFEWLWSHSDAQERAAIRYYMNLRGESGSSGELHRGDGPVPPPRALPSIPGGDGAAQQADQKGE